MPTSPRRAAWCGALALTSIIIVAAALPCSAEPPAAAPPPEPGGPLDLPALVAAAERAHPEVVALRARASAVASGRDAQTALPEPTLAVAVQPLPVETRVGPQRLRVSLSQPLPWPAKLRRRGEVVDRQAAVVDRRVDALRAQLRRGVRLPWLARAQALAAAALVAQQRTLLERIEPALLARLRVGAASYEEAQRLRLAIGELGLNHATLLDQATAAAAAARAAAGVPIDAPLAPPSFEADAAAGAPLPTLAALVPALAGNPAVTTASAAIAAAEAEAAMVATRAAPDFAVGVDWIAVGDARMAGVPDSGSDTLMIMAAVRLPVWRSGYAAAEVAAKQRATAARARREAALRAAEAQLAGLLSALGDARRRADVLERELVPRASSALQTAIGSYAAGRASFQDVFSLHQRVLTLQLAQVAAQAARVRALADLEWLLGRSLAAASTTEVLR